MTSFSVGTVQTTCGPDSNWTHVCDSTDCSPPNQFKCGHYGCAFGYQAAKCAGPDISQCPVFGNGMIVAEGVSFIPGTQDEYQSIGLSCEYNSNQFTTFSQWTSYASQVPSSHYTETGGISGMQLLGTKFCGGIVTSTTTEQCPLNPETGERMPYCSIMSVGGGRGDLCRKWAQAFPQTADIAKNNYCQTNTASADCLCLNRQDNGLYKLMTSSGVSKGQDVCFWRPCNDPVTYLVTSDLNPNNVKCPDVCEIVNEIYQNNAQNININEAKTAINCNFNGHGFGPDGGGGGSTFWDTYKWWIIGGVIAFVVLLIIFLAYRKFKR